MSTADYPDLKKIDLHIHTPRSLCYSDMTVRPEQIVEAALVFGLDAIGVTDHNSAEGVEAVRQAAAREGLAVFPGIELTTRSGHFLAIFDVDMAIARMRDFLDSVGINRERWGDAQEMTADPVEDVMRKVTEAGGLVVAAHIERWPSGFLETKEARTTKMAIHASQYLGALEVTVVQNRGQWQEGRMRGYPTRHACLQGSDAHSPTEVGRRPFLARMEKMDLATLRAALDDYEHRILFPEDLTG